jgi:hypothetical protein
MLLSMPNLVRRRASRDRRRGSSMVEFSLLMPWYAFLFIGAFDFGFYSYGLIATQSAARVAALFCSGSSTRAANCTQACDYAKSSLQNMPNIGTAVTTCTASPLVVTATTTTAVDGGTASSVSVAYTTPTLIPLPGLLPSRFTINRTVIMKAQT